MSGFFNDNEVHVMVDLETLGLTPDSVILSLGAVEFSHNTVDPVTYYRQCSIECQTNRRIDPSTLTWWIGQDHKIPVGDYAVRDVIGYFNDWLQDVNPDGRELIIWSNGTDFDIPLLYNVYKQIGLKPNWKYNSVRDYRTVSKLFSQVPKPEFVGQKHNALDDALNQARHLRLINDYLFRLVYDSENTP